MTTENKSKKIFAKIIIGLVVLFIIILVIGVRACLKHVEDIIKADSRGRIVLGEVLAICKAEQDYKSKTGNFTNDFADLNKDFGGKGNVKETDFIVITLDAPIIHIRSNKKSYLYRVRSIDMDKCEEPSRHFKLMDDKS